MELGRNGELRGEIWAEGATNRYEGQKPLGFQFGYRLAYTSNGDLNHYGKKNIMSQRFRANIFEVEDTEESGRKPFDAALRVAASLPTPRPLLSFNDQDRRIEDFVERDGCCLVNFVTLRAPGPGKASRHTPTTSIGLTPQESFSHETAMLFDPDTQLVFLEGRRPGMGPGAVGQYVARFGDAHSDRYHLVPLLDEEARSRALRNNQIRSFEFKAAVGPDMGMDDQLDSVTSFSNALGGRTVNIQITAARGRDSSLDTESVLSIARNILRAPNRDRVERIRLKGRISEDDPLEVIDLIQQREFGERELEIDPDTRTIPIEARWDALMSIRRNFVVP